MSYCRWSSDDFKSDLYIYEDVSSGWAIHVAGNRVVGDIPKQDWDALDRGDTDTFLATHKAQMDFLDTAKREEITLPHAGETFNLATAGECADKVEELIALGYHVPDGVIDKLRADDH